MAVGSLIGVNSISAGEFSWDESKNYCSNEGYYCLAQPLIFTLFSKESKSQYSKIDYDLEPKAQLSKSYSNFASQVHLKITSKDLDGTCLHLGQGRINIPAYDSTYTTDIPLLRHRSCSLKECMYEYYFSSGNVSLDTIDDGIVPFEKVSIGFIKISLSAKLIQCYYDDWSKTSTASDN